MLSHIFCALPDANEKFEMTAENLNNMKQECESLREELRVLSEKLLKQHDAALESQVWNGFTPRRSLAK